MTEVETARYIYADLSNNNNKFWNATLYDDGSFSATWGRVGETGQSGSWHGGKSKFDAKCREKERKGYERQQVLSNLVEAAPRVSAGTAELARIALSQVETNNDLVKRLLEKLAQANVHSILSQTTLQYDESKGTFSTPLGIVNASAISNARNELNLISTLVSAHDWENRALMLAINKFLMLVPQNIGRQRMTAQALFPDLSIVQQKSDLLDALEASLNSVLTAPQSADGDDTKPAQRVFELKLNLIEDGKEMDRIRAKYRATLQSAHSCAHLDVKQVYEVEIASMKEAFEQYAQRVGNVKELWHGSKVHNILSILKSGMKLMPANSPHVTGRLFGNGHYFSDQSTKSLNYAYGAAPGQNYSGYNDNCFMFLANVAMGKEYTPRAMYETLPRSGYDSTFATARCISTLRNNEMIVYRDDAVNIVRLVEFSKGGK